MNSANLQDGEWWDMVEAASIERTDQPVTDRNTQLHSIVVEDSRTPDMFAPEQRTLF